MDVHIYVVKPFCTNFAFVAFLIQINFLPDQKKLSCITQEQYRALSGNFGKRLKIFRKRFGDTLWIVDPDVCPHLLGAAKRCQ